MLNKEPFERQALAATQRYGLMGVDSRLYNVRYIYVSVVFLQIVDMYFTATLRHTHTHTQYMSQAMEAHLVGLLTSMSRAARQRSDPAR